MSELSKRSLMLSGLVYEQQPYSLFPITYSLFLFTYSLLPIPYLVRVVIII